METQTEHSQSLNFYTTGEALTHLLLDFFKSGEFRKFEEVVQSGGLTHEQVKEAFRLKIQLHGDSREGDLSVEFGESPADFSTLLYHAARMSFRDIYNEDFLELEWMSKHPDATELRVLLRYFLPDELRTICFKEILEEKGYEVSEMPVSKSTTNGVILKDGTFIECGYQDHINLYPVLYSLGLADAPDWTDCDDTVHISSGQLNGTIANALENGRRYRYNPKGEPTEAQLQTLWRLRNHAEEIYGSYEDDRFTANLIRNRFLEDTDMGGKYGHLKFLQKYFPLFKTPRIGTTLEEFEGHEKVFMRTSPMRSLPGLLNSKLILATPAELETTKLFMEEEFEKYREIRGKNKFNWFLQEFLEGSNGVCHIRKMPNISDIAYDFSYQLSVNQGDVVSGKITHEKLSEVQEKYLQEIAETLIGEFRHSLQLEFVVHQEEIYIVQMRILENEYEIAVGITTPEDAIATGITFSKGSEEVAVADILVVAEDAKSEELLGKKALIVENHVEFSHILALAKALKIPAMYGTGKIDLSGLEAVKFTAYTRNAYICSI